MRVLLLDVMDTLVRDPFFEDMPSFFGLSFKELVRSLTPGAWVEFEHGRIDETTFLDRFFHDRRTFDREAFLQRVRAGYRFLDGIESLLTELQNTSVSMHTLSNYPIWYRMIEEELELSRFVSWTFVSCETGLRKPDPEAYRNASKKLGVRASQCLFVDDRESNCEAARAVGMRACVFRDVETLRRDLIAEGFLDSGASIR